MDYVAQEIGKRTLRELTDRIRVGMSEYDIYILCKEIMEREKSEEWWYHGIPCSVAIGEHTILSQSGKDKVLNKTHTVQQNDIITIDVAPSVNKIWGDYARTIVVQDGVACIDIEKITNQAIRKALEFERSLHDELIVFVGTKTTYEDVFDYFNQKIKDQGYENLDFKQNLGHSIELDQKDRIYLEKNNKTCIYDYGKPFAFEPHIRPNNGIFGVKSENIYEFNEDKLRRI